MWIIRKKEEIIHRYFIYYRYNFLYTVGNIFKDEVVTTQTMERDAQTIIEIPNLIEYDSDLMEVAHQLQNQLASQTLGLSDLEILNWYPLLGQQRPVVA